MSNRRKHLESLNGWVAQLLAVLLGMCLCSCTTTKRESPLVVRASIWDYESFSSFREPPEWPGTSYGIEATTEVVLKSIDDKALKAESEHLPAVQVTVRNKGTSETRFAIEGLASVSAVSAKTGQIHRARAIRWLEPGSSRRRYFATFSGTFTFVLQPGGALDFLFLIPQAGAGDVVKVGDKIRAQIDMGHKAN